MNSKGCRAATQELDESHKVVLQVNNCRHIPRRGQGAGVDRQKWIESRVETNKQITTWLFLGLVVFLLVLAWNPYETPSGHVHMYRSLCVHMRVRVRGQPWALFGSSCSLDFLRYGFSLPWTSPIGLGWLASISPKICLSLSLHPAKQHTTFQEKACLSVWSWLP